ncbi:hypothetical protein ACFLR1_05050 [Bacteroidota bacterium]
MDNVALGKILWYDNERTRFSRTPKLIVLYSTNQNNETRFFKLALELEKQFQDDLIENEVHFRASLNSLSLISVGADKPELGVPCKNHNQWTIEILYNYIDKIKSKPNPKRPTPEKSLQAWIIKEAQANDHKLPFDNSISFITSELAIHNSNGTKIVSDIIGYNTTTNQLVIIELKSDRLLKRLIEQVDSFEEIIHDNFWFFHDLVTLHGFGKLEKVSKKAIVWPHKRTSPLGKLKDLDIAEYTYQENGDSYSFIDHSEKPHPYAHLTKFDIEADFVTFREQIVEEFGKSNLEQTMLFFERAVAQANQDLLYSAIADAQTAYTFSQFNDEYRIVYLIGFLSQLHIGTEDFKKARRYCELGYKMLDPDDSDYADDKAKFDELKELIDSESWKDDRNKEE